MTLSTLKTSSPPPPSDLRVPSRLRIHCEEGGVRLEAATAVEGEKPPLRRFHMTAYTGGAMQLAGWRYPVVVDLTGLRVSKKARPILKDHDARQIVGHTDDINVGDRSLEVSGTVSGAGSVAQEVIATSENGFPWQASLGATAEKVVFIAEGRTGTANGREFSGPVYIARKSVLGEVSFVALGADDDTFAHVAAGSSYEGDVEVITMDFEQWALDSGFQIEQMDEKQVTNLSVLYHQQQPATVPPAPKNDAEEQIKQLRAQIAAESRRIEAVRGICAGQHPKIEAQAIEEGWDEAKTELAVLRASRPAAPAVGASSPPLSTRILEAAACMSVGFNDTELAKEYGDQTVNAAYVMRNISFKELVAECARLEGLDVPRVFGNGKETIQAGFSTISLPGILENVMNKTLLAAYETTGIAAFELCTIGSVADFKEVSRYRLLGTGGFEPIAPDGELKHGKLGEQKYSNRADTYGQILTLTRKDIINDDLDAFMDIPRQMGRSGAELIDDLFFTLLLSNPGSFFSGGNGNYLAGADTAFGSDALTKAKTQFRKQKAGPGTKAKDQKPINVRPEILLVPVEVETDAELLMGSAQLMIDASGTATKIPVDNPHRNKYRIVSVPHLSDTFYTGASAKAWYLFANPRVLAAFEIVFLNGRRTPIIEQVEAPPNMLGMGFRGYLDVGVKEQDHRGALRMKGEA
ncbi:MAG: hypothetical protein RIC55_02465 [Pirellulaceae bacterium]